MKLDRQEVTMQFCQVYARLDTARSLLADAESHGCRCLTATQREQLQTVAGHIDRAIGMILDAGRTAIYEAESGGK
jgi:hypothetical protein